MDLRSSRLGDSTFDIGSVDWIGVTGVQLQPLVDALREVVLGQQVIHADETPVHMLMPGTKKTHRSYVWAYATSQFSDLA
ncbi:ISPpu14, transposase Orf3, partial [Pseudomonas amygdali pv. eriobotryae]